MTTLRCGAVQFRHHANDKAYNQSIIENFAHLDLLPLSTGRRWIRGRRPSSIVSWQSVLGTSLIPPKLDFRPRQCRRSIICG